MEQTHDHLEYELKRLLSEYKVEHDHRVLATVIRKLATLDPKFRKDYVELEKYFIGELDFDLDLALRAMTGIRILSVLRGLLSESLCQTIDQLYKLIREAFPYKQEAEEKEEE